MGIHTLGRYPSMRIARWPASSIADSSRTKRNLATVRLMYIAAETGARFVRDRLDLEPLDWLLGSKRLLNGRSPMDACTQPEGFRRAVLLHELGLGIDVDPRVVIGIPATEFISARAQRYLGTVPPNGPLKPDPWERKPAALFTSSICADIDESHIQIFSAMIARSSDEVRQRLRRRYGPLLEDEARVRLGFDWSEPLATAMVSDAMAHVLSLIEKNPTCALANGLDFNVEQRFSEI